MFERKGQIYIDGTKYDEDEALEAALEAGAEDFKARRRGATIVTTDPHAMHAVQAALEAEGFAIVEAEIAFVPKSTCT